jgi:thiamine biosynthesis lipoprotein
LWCGGSRRPVSAGGWGFATRSSPTAGPSLTYADAFATAAFVMGEPGVTWVSGIDGYGALAITEDRRTVWTSGVDRPLMPPTAPAT